MWNRFRRFSALPWQARVLFFRAVVLLPLVAVNLKVRGFRATQEWLGRRSVRGSGDMTHTASLSYLNERASVSARMVEAAARYFWPKSTCFVKSLVLWRLLNSQGIASSLRIGARKSAGIFEAHAWLERQGVALNDSDRSHREYAAFDSEFPLEVETS